MISPKRGAMARCVPAVDPRRLGGQPAPSLFKICSSTAA